MKKLFLILPLMLCACTTGAQQEALICKENQTLGQIPMFGFAGGAPMIIGFIPTCEDKPKAG